MLTNNVIVGYYSAADKLITCVRRCIYAVSDAIYPFISKMMKDDISKGLQFIKKTNILVFGCWSYWLYVSLFLLRYYSQAIVRSGL